LHEKKLVQEGMLDRLLGFCTVQIASLVFAPALSSGRCKIHSQHARPMNSPAQAWGR